MSIPIQKFAQYFSDAITQCFGTQVGVPVKVSVQDKSVSKGDLITSIGFSSSKTNGTVSIIFPTPVFLEAVNTMLGESETAITESNADAASELLNIIYCLARPKLNADGEDFAPAIPQVIFGKDLSVGETKNGTSFHLVAETAKGQFHLTGNVQNRA